MLERLTSAHAGIAASNAATGVIKILMRIDMFLNPPSGWMCSLHNSLAVFGSPQIGDPPAPGNCAIPVRERGQGQPSRVPLIHFTWPSANRAFVPPPSEPR